MAGWVFWTLAVAAAVLVGVGTGGLPLGGKLAAPLLSLRSSPATAAGFLMPICVPTDIFGRCACRRAFDRLCGRSRLPG